MPASGRSRSTLAFSCALVAAGTLADAALADDFTGLVDLDWFNPMNWSGGALPSGVATIDGGFEVVAAGAMPVTCSTLRISRDGTGNALVSVVDLLVENIDIGAPAAFSGAAGSYEGSLHVTGANIDMGSYGEIDLGFNRGNPGASPTGSLVLEDGDLVSVYYVLVGTSFQDGSGGHGELIVRNGDIIGDEVEIYVAEMSDAGFTTGLFVHENGVITGGESLEVADNGNGLDEVSVGEARFVNSTVHWAHGLRCGRGDAAQGRVELDASYQSTRRLRLGDGSTLAFHVDGTERVTATEFGGTGRYAAIDVGVSTNAIDLAGRLELLFGYVPADGDTFDVIRLAPEQVFTGTFAELVSVDLVSGMVAQFEIVPADVTSGEILRVTVVGTPCPADVDGDGAVGFSDVLAVLASWDDAGTAADVDGDGTVGFTDLLTVLAAWGPCV